LDTIIDYDCDCPDSLVVEDINLNIKRGVITTFPGGCMDGKPRRSASVWLLTDTDTLWFSCDAFFLKKGKGENYYETIVDTNSLLKFKDILNSFEDSLSNIQK